MWVLRTEPGSFVGPVSSLNHRAISAAPFCFLTVAVLCLGASSSSCLGFPTIADLTCEPEWPLCPLSCFCRVLYHSSEKVTRSHGHVTYTSLLFLRCVVWLWKLSHLVPIRTKLGSEPRKLVPSKPLTRFSLSSRTLRAVWYGRKETQRAKVRKLPVSVLSELTF